MSRWVIAFSLLALTHGPSQSTVPADVIDALQPATTRTPWLARLDQCLDAPSLTSAEETPYDCMPPLSTTVGFSADSRRVASLESPVDPGCGDHVADAMHQGPRRHPDRATIARIGAPGDTLGTQLTVLWRLMAILPAAGYEPAQPATLATPQLAKDHLLYQPGALLGPPLTGHFLYLDAAKNSVSLYQPDGTRHRLARLPTLPDGAMASLWEVAITPDARTLIVRVAALQGTPCDPAAIEVLRLRIPVRPDRTLPDDSAFNRLQRCRTGDDHACKLRCRERATDCARSAGAVIDRGPPDDAALETLAELYDRGCKRGDTAACLALAETFARFCKGFGSADKAGCRSMGETYGERPGPVRFPVKGIPRPTETIEKTVIRLKRQCWRDPLACLELARIYKTGRYAVRPEPRRSKEYARKALPKLRARCAANTAVCPKVTEAEALLR